LKPCPFHPDPETLSPELGKDSLIVTKLPWVEDFAVQCDWCGSCGPMAKTESMAVRKWNKREV
jgi:hypothetical protein